MEEKKTPPAFRAEVQAVPGPTPRPLLVAFLGDDDRPQGRAFFDALDNAAKSLERVPLSAWEDLDPEVRRAYAGAEAELAETGGRRLAEVSKGIADSVNRASFEQAAGNLPDFVAGELAARVLLAVGDAVRKRDTLRLGGWTSHELALGTQIARLAGIASARVEDREGRPKLESVESDRPMESEVAFIERVLAWLDVPGIPAKLEHATSCTPVAAVQTGEPPTMVIGPSDGAGGVNVPPGATAWGDMGVLGARLYAPQALRDVLVAAMAWAYTPSNAEIDDTPAALLAAVRAAVESGILPRPLWTANGIVVDAVAEGFDEPDELPEARDVALEATLLGETADRGEKVLNALTAVVCAVRDDLDPDEPDDSDALADALEHVIADGGADLAAYVADLRSDPKACADLRALAESEAKSAAAQQYHDLKRALAIPSTEGPTFNDLVILAESFRKSVTVQLEDLKIALGVPTTKPQTFADLVKLARSFRQSTITQYDDLKRALAVASTDGPTFGVLVDEARSCRQSAAELRALVQAQHNDLRRALRVPEHANPMFGELARHVHDVVTKAEELQKKRGLTFRHGDAAFTRSVLSALDVQIEAQSRIADAASKAAEEARNGRDQDRQALASLLSISLTATHDELLAVVSDRVIAASSIGMGPRLRSVVGLTGTESVDECLAVMRQRLDELARVRETAEKHRQAHEDEIERSKRLVRRADSEASDKRQAIESRDEAKRQRDAARDALAKAKIDLANACGDFDALTMALGVKVPATLRDVLDALAKLRKDLETFGALASEAHAVAFREVADVFGVDLDTQHPSEVVSAARVLWGSHVDGSEDGAVAVLDVLRKALVKIEELHNGASVLLKSAETPEHLFGDAHRLGLLEEAVGMIGCGVSDALDVLPPKGDA